MARKYHPWIDRKYYPATRFACKMIGQGKSFSTAVRIAANYYNLEYDDVAHYAHEWMNPPEKIFYYYVVELVIGDGTSHKVVKKALSGDNAVRVVSRSVYVNGREYVPQVTRVTQFSTKAEAEANAGSHLFTGRQSLYYESDKD